MNSNLTAAKMKLLGIVMISIIIMCLFACEEKQWRGRKVLAAEMDWQFEAKPAGGHGPNEELGYAGQ